MLLLAKVDAALYRAEKAAVAAMLAAMGLVVFLDVVHRVATREGSWLANPVVVGVVAVVVAALAFRTRGKPAAWGVGAGLAFVAAQAAFVKLVPNGLVWSQTLALALTLWLGLMGASLAAHERRHLALDVGSKLWPASMVNKAAAVGHFLTAAFCVGLLWLGWRSVGAHFDLWTSTEGAAGTLSGLAIPKWAANLAIPYGMAALGFRFALEGVRTWRGELEVGGDDTLHQLGIEDVAGGKA